MAEHNTLTGSSLHEPKGAAAAASGKVYVADGAGSGSWTTVDESNVSGRQVILQITFDTTTVDPTEIISPFTGTVTEIYYSSDDLNDSCVVDTRIAGAILGTSSVTLSGASDHEQTTPTTSTGITAGQTIGPSVTTAATTGALGQWLVTIDLT